MACISSCGMDDRSPNDENQLSIETKDTVNINKQTEQNKELEQLHKPYDPNADAFQDLTSLVDSAKKVNKNIIVQAGGNWCIWCLRFEKFRTENDSISRIIDRNYLYYHLNYSEENKNEEILSSLGNPGKLGYPVFIILDKNGKLIHTQGSEQLEDGVNSYDEKKVIAFLNQFAQS